MREFTEQQGGELLDWAQRVMDAPDFVEIGDHVINTLPAKVALFGYALEYGIGTPNKAAPEAEGKGIQIVVKYPLGVDPDDVRALQARGERGEAGLVIQPGQPKKAPPVLTQALLKAAGAVPELVPDPDGLDDLEPVGDHDPAIGDDPSFDVPSGS